MSMAIQGYGGTCPCIACQKALTRTPAQRLVAKMRKNGQKPKWAKKVDRRQS